MQRRDGAHVALGLLVDFPDVRNGVTRAEVEAGYNQRGYRGFGNHGSVRDYFAVASGGRVDVTCVLAEVQASRPRSYYDTRTDGARELVREVVQTFIARGVELGDVTTDDAGFVRALHVLVAGTSARHLELWRHQGSLEPAIVTASGERFADYHLASIGAALQIGPLCHDHGHMLFDFPDIYNRNGYVSRGAGVEHVCLMGSGGEVADANQPPPLSAYPRLSAGWATALELDRGMRVTLAIGELAFLRKSTTEYLLFEVRAGQGSAPRRAHIIVWQVDERGDEQILERNRTRYECVRLESVVTRPTGRASDWLRVPCDWSDGDYTLTTLDELVVTDTTIAFYVDYQR